MSNATWRRDLIENKFIFHSKIWFHFESISDDKWESKYVGSIFKAETENEYKKKIPFLIKI